MTILVTGAAGFIGFHLIRTLKSSDDSLSIIALDNFNDYYDPALKEERSRILEQDFGVPVMRADINDPSLFRQIEDIRFDTVVHLAAQAGVRYSIENPKAYVDSNILGYANILEFCRDKHIPHLVYASSSSVYGNDSEIPYSEAQPFRSFESLYAVSKAANEMMASVYAKHYRMNITGLRFFTVYGSFGRPDMAYYSFARAITDGTPIRVFNGGNLKRDFTHVSDVVNGIRLVIEGGPPDIDTGSSGVYNIGRGNPVDLMRFISILEEQLGKKAIKENVGMQPGDVFETWADISALTRDYGYSPAMNIDDGITEFLNWFKDYHGTD